MHVLTVAYGHPTDTAAFDNHYATTHAPLARNVPGLVDFTARRCSSLDGCQPPYYLIAQLAFTDENALTAALQSTEGRAAAGDINNFADGGATIFVQHD